MVQLTPFFQALADAHIDFFSGVPDSLLKDFCAYITDHFPPQRHIIAANEGNAIGCAAGYALATGNPACVYMQNSGQGNAVNPLLSLTSKYVYSIPLLLFIGWRGEPGVSDEPQHLHQGKVTQALCDVMDIPWYVLPNETAEACHLITEVCSRIREQNTPVALLVRKGTFAPYQLQSCAKELSSLSRESAIQAILKSIPADAIIVSTTGMISREVYETRVRLGQEHKHDFLTVGSMGHALQIALGIALARPMTKVYCLDGDGAAIMHLGGMAIVGQQQCPNLTHILINNAAHDSVGGQPTVGGNINFALIATACGYYVLPSINNLNKLPSLLASQHIRKPTFLEIRVKKGARKDLGRPKESPLENKKIFMQFLKEATL